MTDKELQEIKSNITMLLTLSWGAKIFDNCLKLINEVERLQSENEGLKTNNMLISKILERKMTPMDNSLIVQFQELQSENTRLRKELEQVKAERDKAVGDAEKGRVCYTCIHYDKDCSPLNPDTGCHGWKWQGLEESE